MITRQAEREADCSPGAKSRALCGWSPASLPADTPLKRAVDRYLPLTGVPSIAFFLTVAGMLLVAGLLPRRPQLALDAITFLAGGGWCALNFWRCRHAHCLVDGVGWLALSVFTFGEAIAGRSFIHGDEQLIFLAVLLLSVMFELVWSATRGTNALVRRVG